MSNSELYQDVRKLYSNIRCESVSVDSDITSSGTLEALNIVSEDSLTVGNNLILEGSDSVVDFISSDASFSRIQGNIHTNFTFTPKAGTMTNGNLTLRISEFGGVCVGTVIMGPRNLLGAGIQELVWEAPAEFLSNPRFNITDPQFAATTSVFCLPLDSGTDPVPALMTLDDTGEISIRRADNVAFAYSLAGFDLAGFFQLNYFTT